MRAFVAVGWVVLVGCVIACGGAGVSSPSDPESEARGAGYTFAKKLVPKLLKSPSTATFTREDLSVRKMKDFDGAPRYAVTGNVDSQNSFGAMIRTQWLMVVVHDVQAKEWMGVQLFLDGEEVFSLDGYESKSAAMPPPSIGSPPKPTPAAPATREWTTPDGLLVAEFVEFKANKAILRKENGSTVEYPSVKLSKSDQEFIREELKRRKTK